MSGSLNVAEREGLIQKGYTVVGSTGADHARSSGAGLRRQGQPLRPLHRRKRRARNCLAPARWLGHLRQKE